MFKPTPTLQKTLRRLPLSPKQAGKEYYKGSGAGNLGTIDKYGRFHPDYSKIRTFVYPVGGVRNFELTPFVSKSVSKNVQESIDKWSVPPKGLTGEEYLARWKSEGGHDEVAGAWGDDAQDQRTNMPEVYEEKTGKK